MNEQSGIQLRIKKYWYGKVLLTMQGMFIHMEDEFIVHFQVFFPNQSGDYGGSFVEYNNPLYANTHSSFIEAKQAHDGLFGRKGRNLAKQMLEIWLRDEITPSDQALAQYIIKSMKTLDLLYRLRFITKNFMFMLPIRLRYFARMTILRNQ